MCTHTGIHMCICSHACAHVFTHGAHRVHMLTYTHVEAHRAHMLTNTHGGMHGAHALIHT